MRMEESFGSRQRDQLPCGLWSHLAQIPGSSGCDWWDSAEKSRWPPPQRFSIGFSTQSLFCSPNLELLGDKYRLKRRLITVLRVVRQRLLLVAGLTDSVGSKHSEAPGTLDWLAFREQSKFLRDSGAATGCTSAAAPPSRSLIGCSSGWERRRKAAE